MLPDKHNWTEDYPHENGCYQNRCTECGVLFLGNKIRRVCKVCANTDKERPDFEKAANDHAVLNYSGTVTSAYIMAVSRHSFVAGCNHGYDLSMKRIEELEAVLSECGKKLKWFNDLKRNGIKSMKADDLINSIDKLMERKIHYNP